MDRHRFATALAAMVLLTIGAGCSNDTTPADSGASGGSPTPAGTSSPAAATTPLDGKWTASISLAAAKATLRAAGMGRLIPRVVACPGCLPSRDFELRIAGEQLILFSSTGDVIDDGAITIKGHHMIVENSEVPGQAVLGFKVDTTTLRLSFISQSRPEYKPGLTEEPIIRMLYTTVPWTRAS
jgi:hypothetical protein